jgi:hypothetical protein
MDHFGQSWVVRFTIVAGIHKRSSVLFAGREWGEQAKGSPVRSPLNSSSSSARNRAARNDQENNDGGNYATAKLPGDQPARHPRRTFHMFSPGEPSSHRGSA